jgi:hypothetical protein
VNYLNDWMELEQEFEATPTYLRTLNVIRGSMSKFLSRFLHLNKGLWLSTVIMTLNE